MRSGQARMERGSLTPCTTRKEQDFFIKKQKRKSKPPNGFFDAETLSYAAGNSKYIYIYIFIYVY